MPVQQIESKIPLKDRLGRVREYNTESHSIHSPTADESPTVLFDQITVKGIVPPGFQYIPNPFQSSHEKFLAFVSHIDYNTHTIYLQPDCHLTAMQELTEQLDAYYSHPISDKLLVNNISTGLACVKKLDEVYHRVYIKERTARSCTVIYVDLGMTEQVLIEKAQIKHLLTYFATAPCIAIPCRLADIELIMEKSMLPERTRQMLQALDANGPFNIVPCDVMNDMLCIQICDGHGQCLNETLVQHQMASRRDDRCPPQSPNEVTRSTLMNDYEDEDSIPPTSKQTHFYDDYISDDFISTPRIQAPTRHVGAKTKQDKKILHQHAPQIHDRPYSNGTTHIRSQHGSNQRNQVKESHGQQLSQESPQMTITFDSFNGGGRRLIRPSFNGRHQKTIVNSDDFNEWICTCTEKHSLWLNETYRSALLKYIGRIYNERVRIYRYYTQLRKEHVAYDELDLLKHLIEMTKSKQNAQNSFNQWEDQSRINRRVDEIGLIFDFDGNRAKANKQFLVRPEGVTKIIEAVKIGAYFDLGCGDGNITAAIGTCLGLPKSSIFGGDVYEGQNPDITFIRLSENQSRIDLEDNSVDLITSFVTFHHVTHLRETILELARILRPGGYLIFREHDCSNERSVSSKYLHFVHAIMMIAGVGEFAASSNHRKNEDEHASTNDWQMEKRKIMEYLKTIHYHSCDEFEKELRRVGFTLRATLSYGDNASTNPQHLFYGVFRLEKK